MTAQLATTAFLALGLLQGPSPRPQVTPFPIDGGGAAFLVKMTNPTAAPLQVWPDGNCRLRLDGGPRETDWGSSGGVYTVAAGASWQELVKLVPWPPSMGGRRPANPYADRVTVLTYRERHADLAYGDHMIAFTCRGEWSADVHFTWTRSDDEARSNSRKTR